MKKCPFCNYKQLKKQGIIFETKHFMFIKDLYPVVEGHCLLICKNHIRKESEIVFKEEFAFACDKAWRYVAKEWGNPITFVHPPELQTVYHYHRHYIPVMKRMKPEFVKEAIKKAIYRREG